MVAEMSIDWASLHIAVVGGDPREQEIARLAATTGARVTAYGFPWLEEGIEGVERVGSAVEALRGADFGLLPIPMAAVPGHLYAPAVEEPVPLGDDVLSEMAPGATIFLGRADDTLREVAGRCGIELEDYDPDRELMLLRGPAIVEGAIGAAIANTRITINHAPIVVLGFGNIGTLLARALLALGGRVTVAARNPIQRANAYAMGAETLTIDELPEHAGRFPMLFSTTAAGPIVTRPILERLPARSVLIDIAPPPGSVDFDLARELGHTAIWARGLGSRAPVTVGASQWYGLRRRIEERVSARVDRTPQRA
jgi:dipicolinate synthase subunit A